MESIYYAPFWAANPILYIRDYCQRVLQSTPIVSFQADQNIFFTCIIKIPDTKSSAFYGNGRTKKDAELDAAFSCCIHINQMDMERTERLCGLDRKARTQFPPQHQSPEWATKVVRELQKALGCTPKVNYHDAIRYWICEAICGDTVGVGKSGSKKYSQLLAFSDLVDKAIKANNNNNQNCSVLPPIQDISELTLPPTNEPPKYSSIYLPPNKTPKQYLNEWAQKNYKILPLFADSFEDDKFSCIVTVPPAMETLPGHGVGKNKQGASQQAAMDFLVKNELLTLLESDEIKKPSCYDKRAIQTRTFKKAKSQARKEISSF